jgi:hypothetical protein
MFRAAVVSMVLAAGAVGLSACDGEQACAAGAPSVAPTAAASAATAAAVIAATSAANSAAANADSGGC